MGVKVIYGTVGFIGASGVLLCTGLMFPQHTVSFFSLYGIRVARMWTYMSSIQTESTGNDFCRALRQIVTQDKLTWCDNLDGMTDIQDVQQRFCAPMFERIWPSFCLGLSQAYGIGMCVLLVAVLNIGLQMAAVYLLLDYGRRKANPKYRKSSMVALALGLGMLVLVLMIYGSTVLTRLSSVQTSGPLSSVFSAVLSVSKGMGASSGYLILWTGALFQFIALCLFSQVKTEGQEYKFTEDKAIRDYDGEVSRGYGAAASAGATSGMVGPASMQSPIPTHQVGSVPMANAALGQGMGFGGHLMAQPQGLGQPHGFGQPQGFGGMQQGFRQQGGGDFGL